MITNQYLDYTARTTRLCIYNETDGYRRTSWLWSSFTRVRPALIGSPRALCARRSYVLDVAGAPNGLRLYNAVGAA